MRPTDADCKGTVLRFSHDEIPELRTILSEERILHWQHLAKDPKLAAWRVRTGCALPVSDEHAALLHEWNATLAASFMASLQIFEVSLRNHIHDALSREFKTENWWGSKSSNVWIASKNVLSTQIDDVNKAINISARRKKGVTAGGVISELSFGFWLALLGPSYDNPNGVAHWRNCLYAVFDERGKVSRKEVHQELESIVRLRNSCAHHEPIVTLDLNFEYQNMLRFAKRFSRTTATWIEQTSLIPHLVKPDWLHALRVSGRLIGSQP